MCVCVCVCAGVCVRARAREFEQCAVRVCVCVQFESVCVCVRLYAGVQVVVCARAHVPAGGVCALCGALWRMPVSLRGGKVEM